VIRVPIISAKISVIVPSRDTADDLAACLDSIAGQTHRQLELITVDGGGSPDMARNRGLEMATGEFLAFADGDYILAANAYERMLHSLAYTGSDFASGYATQGRIDRTHVSKAPELLHDVSLGNKLFRRSFWDLHRFRFPEGAVAGGPGQSNAVSDYIQLMTTAHVLAKRVDVIPDAMYSRREQVRDSGSIAGLRDRMLTLAAIDTLLASYGPAKLLRAHQIKVLTEDLWSYVRDMHTASQAHRAEFAVLVAPYLDTVSPRLLRHLPSAHKRAYQLVREGAMPELAQFAHQLTNNPSIAPSSVL
jgi:CDP-glycerol glycerophosphotransferase